MFALLAPQQAQRHAHIATQQNTELLRNILETSVAPQYTDTRGLTSNAVAVAMRRRQRCRRRRRTCAHTLSLVTEFQKYFLPMASAAHPATSVSGGASNRGGAATSTLLYSPRTSLDPVRRLRPHRLLRRRAVVERIAVLVRHQHPVRCCESGDSATRTRRHKATGEHF
jgi:hypothetical protein